MSPFHWTVKGAPKHSPLTSVPWKKRTTKAPPSRKHRHTTTAKKASASPAMPTFKLFGSPRLKRTPQQKRPDAGAALLVCREDLKEIRLQLTICAQRLIYMGTSTNCTWRDFSWASRPCLETMLQLVGQQLQAPICCTSLSAVQSAGQHMERQGHMQVSFSFTSRSAGQQAGVSRSPPWEDPNYVWSWGPAELRGTTSGTTSKRRPGAGTLAHGNRQHHNTEEGSVLAKKQKHACSF